MKLNKSTIKKLLSPFYREKNEELLNDIISELYDYVYFWCLYYLKNHEDAADLCQEILLKILNLLRNPDKHLKSEKIDSYLNVIIKNTYLNFCRKNENRRKHLDNLSSITQENSFTHLYVEININGLKDFLKSKLVKVIDKRFFELMVEGYSNEEIGEILDLSIKQVSNRKNRIRNLLRKVLKKIGSY